MEWRISSRPSASRSVMIASSLSLVDAEAGVDQLAVDLAAQGSACETAPMLCATSATVTAALRFPFRTIRQGNDRHLFKIPKQKARGFGAL